MVRDLTREDASLQLRVRYRDSRKRDRSADFVAEVNVSLDV